MPSLVGSEMCIRDRLLYFFFVLNSSPENKNFDFSALFLPKGAGAQTSWIMGRIMGLRLVLR